MEKLFEIPIAHRGLHGDGIPENSMAAFQRAADRGYCIETDIHFTADGQLVVFHDDDLNRMAGIDKKICDCALTELQAVCLQGTEETIPSFLDVLELVDGRVPLLIEIKDMPAVKAKRIARALSEAMRNYRGDYAVQSFNPLYVRAYKKLRPEVLCGVLGVDRKGSRGLKNKLIDFVVRDFPLNFYVKPDFISYCKEDFFRKRILNFKGRRLAWTVRSREEEDRIRPVCDNIIFEGFLPEFHE